ncbi:bifunctional (p)ppGpp synthetase/guanosine-3',5'-bis(diphosphate) 3'-pyrophosphohydrolase [Rhodobacteraceae bacterium 63075]|nr:bifunctional (p)ppGpp synthetase/guanosine-3',5'-bis(diphosphate) 3'-pyrophosphohydrolase [Rhodobacteraceae bacterium 63075]
MLTHRFDDALAHASALHRSQTRKGSGTPYIAHLMSVSALVLEYGGDEDQAIAGLLHDAVEDQGGMATHAEITRRYGPRVASIVLECSDSDGEEKAAWQTRKDAYIAGVATKSDDAVLVTACDKLHNATSILHDLTNLGDALWSRFTAGRTGTLWYYRALSDALSMRLPGPLTDRLSRTISAIEEQA